MYTAHNAFDILRLALVNKTLSANTLVFKVVLESDVKYPSSPPTSFFELHKLRLSARQPGRFRTINTIPL